jgi:mannose-6-phosphate isomerase-like protein (cupin superfamily)
MDALVNRRRRPLLAIVIACAAVLGLARADLAWAQETPAPASPPAGAQKPPAPRPARRQAATPAVTTAVVTVTDATGEPLPATEVRVVTGPVERHGRTAANGSLNIAGLRAGAYRFRFARDGFVTLERDVTVRAGQRETIDVVLSEADSPRGPERAETEQREPEAAAPQASTPAATAAGEPRAMVVADFVERNFIGGREPRREDEVGCTATARTTLLQLRDSTREEARADADEVLYVVAGEGTLRLGSRDVRLASSTVAVVPRGTARAITRKGRNPLILLSVVSGPACAE